MASANGIVIGPINSGTAFMLVRIGKGTSGATGPVPMFLNVKDQGDAGLVYYWERAIEKLSDEMPIFAASGGDNNFALSDRTNSGGLGVLNDGTQLILKNSGTPLILRYLQSTYAEWFPPTQFLANVPYSIYSTKDLKNPVVIYNSDAIHSDDVAPATDVMMLPTVIFSISGGNLESLVSPADTMREWFCMAQHLQVCTLGNGNTGPTFLNAYTLRNDADRNYLYSYCPVNNTCGAGNCNGPCGVIYDDCVASTANVFGCIFDSNKYFSESSWWKSMWFIITISVIFAVIVIMLIAGLVWGIKAKKQNDKDIEAGKEPQYKLLSPDLDWS